MIWTRLSKSAMKQCMRRSGLLRPHESMNVACTGLTSFHATGLLCVTVSNWH